MRELPHPSLRAWQVPLSRFVHSKRTRRPITKWRWQASVSQLRFYVSTGRAAAANALREPRPTIAAKVKGKELHGDTDLGPDDFGQRVMQHYMHPGGSTVRTCPWSQDQGSIELHSPGTPGGRGPFVTMWFSSVAQVRALMSCAVKCSNCIGSHSCDWNASRDKTCPHQHSVFSNLQGETTAVVLLAHPHPNSGCWGACSFLTVRVFQASLNSFCPRPLLDNLHRGRTARSGMVLGCVVGRVAREVSGGRRGKFKKGCAFKPGGVSGSASTSAMCSGRSASGN